MLSVSIGAGQEECPLNQRAVIRMNAQEQREVLRSSSKASLATLDGDGFPHLVAMAYTEVDGKIVMTSYAKAQKVLNVRREPKVAVMVEVGSDYSDYRGILIRGTCELNDDHQAVVDAMQRILGNRLSEVAVRRAAKRIVMTVTPTKIATWDHTKLSGGQASY